ncbi:unnamed protein product [Amoebophrya sp. A25]|nr:unnamed protein product [Amoebophrya sp. A25]|eukprot:GSA25T00004722001.1
MSAVVSSGGFVSEGGPYYMISRAMGPAIGVTVGLLYWLGISLLAVLETLGAVEALVIARPSLKEMPGHMQLFGSIILFGMVMMVYMGIKFVTKMGVVFVFVVFSTLAMFYVGFFTVDTSKDFAGPPGEVTGLSGSTLEGNFPPHYDDGIEFGVVMSWFFPCFTGILSGANRADILRNPPRDLKVGTLGAIIFSLFMYSSFMILWGSVARYSYLRGDWENYAGDGRLLGEVGEQAGAVPETLTGTSSADEHLRSLSSHAIQHPTSTGSSASSSVAAILSGGRADPSSSNVLMPGVLVGNSAASSSSSIFGGVRRSMLMEEHDDDIFDSGAPGLLSLATEQVLSSFTRETVTAAASGLAGLFAFPMERSGTRETSGRTEDEISRLRARRLAKQQGRRRPDHGQNEQNNSSFVTDEEDTSLFNEAAVRRRLAGGKGAYVFEEIAWSPFPYAVHIGIIFSSISQALQCLIVAPRLLQAIARDNVLPWLNVVAPLSRHGEPIRALGYTYIVCALLVLIGSLDVVAPLLTMCFLACYINMNLSVLILTCLKAPSWRPSGIQRKRWRLWYKFVGLSGVVLGLFIMFRMQWVWALITCLLAATLYVYVDFRAETSEWGSGLDGIKFHLALNALLSLEQTQRHKVNWRPQVLILYRVHMADIMRKNRDRTRHHEILQFYSQLRKGRGMCVVAAVLEGDKSNEKMLKKARIEKEIIMSIMKQNEIQGFAQVVVAPNWCEGANYILQLTGLGGLVPNTVLMAWPSNWANQPLAVKREKALAFCDIVAAAHAEDKTILVARDPKDFPDKPCHGTIDVWWMIHDGGLLILVSWLLQQHKIWRGCKMRVFTVMEDITEQEAATAARVLTQTLQKKRLLNVDVEVIMAEHTFVEPFVQHAHNYDSDEEELTRELIAPVGSPPVDLHDVQLQNGARPAGGTPGGVLPYISSVENLQRQILVGGGGSNANYIPAGGAGDHLGAGSQGGNNQYLLSQMQQEQPRSNSRVIAGSSSAYMNPGEQTTTWEQQQFHAGTGPSGTMDNMGYDQYLNDGNLRRIPASSRGSSALDLDAIGDLGPVPIPTIIEDSASSSAGATADFRSAIPFGHHVQQMDSKGNWYAPDTVSDTSSTHRRLFGGPLVVQAQASSTLEKAGGGSVVVPPLSAQPPLAKGRSSNAKPKHVGLPQTIEDLLPQKMLQERKSKLGERSGNDLQQLQQAVAGVVSSGGPGESAALHTLIGAGGGGELTTGVSGASLAIQHAAAPPLGLPISTLSEPNIQVRAPGDRKKSFSVVTVTRDGDGCEHIEAMTPGGHAISPTHFDNDEEQIVMREIEVEQPSRHTGGGVTKSRTKGSTASNEARTCTTKVIRIDKVASQHYSDGAHMSAFTNSNSDSGREHNYIEDPPPAQDHDGSRISLPAAVSSGATLLGTRAFGGRSGSRDLQREVAMLEQYIEGSVHQLPQQRGSNVLNTNASRSRRGSKSNYGVGPRSVSDADIGGERERLGGGMGMMGMIHRGGKAQSNNPVALALSENFYSSSSTASINDVLSNSLDRIVGSQDLQDSGAAAAAGEHGAAVPGSGAESALESLQMTMGSPTSAGAEPYAMSGATGSGPGAAALIASSGTSPTNNGMDGNRINSSSSVMGNTPKRVSTNSASRQGSKSMVRGTESLPEIPEQHSLLAFRRLNSIIQARSRRAELVIMNLPDLWDHTDPNECVKYLRCAEALVDRLERVLFVHGSGHEVFDIGS